MRLISLLGILFSSQILASSLPTMSQIASQTISLTEDMAKELGMTEVDQYIENADKQHKYYKDYKLDLQNDEVNRNLAPVVVIVNKGSRSDWNPEGQTAKFYYYGRLEGIYDVSTGKNGMVKTTNGRVYLADTNVGFYRIKRAYKNYFSKTFFGAYMQYAMFFDGGIALHATKNLERLGYRDSGGCVRMRKEDIYQISRTILSTGENHNNISVQKVCKEDELGMPTNDCFERQLYTNRIKLPDVSSTTGLIKLNKEIWTYDAYIVVKDFDPYSVDYSNN